MRLEALAKGRQLRLLAQQALRASRRLSTSRSLPGSVLLRAYLGCRWSPISCWSALRAAVPRTDSPARSAACLLTMLCAEGDNADGRRLRLSGFVVLLLGHARENVLCLAR